MNLERGLRAAALLIVVLAIIDPVFSRSLLARQSVVVLQASSLPTDRDLAATLSEGLAAGFDVSRSDVPGAVAYVLAGADLPDGWRPPAAAAVFAVSPDPNRLGVRVAGLSEPAQMSIHSIAPIDVELHVDGSGDREVAIALIVDGVRVQDASRRITGQETRMKVPLAFVPSRSGLIRVRVEATVPGRDAAIADAVVDVTRRVWRVLAFDARPTYAATFVRRALEADPRFDVTSRIVTSRASAVQTGPAPPSVGVSGALDGFDLVIIGAADSLGARDKASLNTYLRERHGAVILLPETLGGSVLSSLTGQSVWQEDRRNAPVRVGQGDTWSASEFFWPSIWPPLAEPVATFTDTEPRARQRYPVWQMPVGSGRLVVSSAVDGWRSRAGAALGFSAFWRAVAAAAASATPSLVNVDVSTRVLRPGESAGVRVQTFSGAAPTAQLRDGSGASSPVRLWPASTGTTSGAAAEWEGSFRAPDVPGTYRLDASTAAGSTGNAEILVIAPASPGARDTEWVPVPAEGKGMAAAAAVAHRGTVVPAANVATLRDLIANAVTAGPQQTPWNPMRSVWWLVPFTACASGEWWLRRRRGQR